MRSVTLWFAAVSLLSLVVGCSSDPENESELVATTSAALEADTDSRNIPFEEIKNVVQKLGAMDQATETKPE